MTHRKVPEAYVLHTVKEISEKKPHSEIRGGCGRDHRSEHGRGGIGNPPSKHRPSGAKPEQEGLASPSLANADFSVGPNPYQDLTNVAPFLALMSSFL